MTDLLVAALVFAFSICATGVVRRYSLRHNLLDVPNERSSHSLPTPRGGGLAVVLGVILGLTALLAWGRLNAELYGALTVGGLLVAAIGLADDRASVGPLSRFTVHVTASIWAVFSLGGLQHLDFGFGVIELGLGGSFLAVVGLTGLLNIYNFMDGIDGLAASEGLFVAGVGAGLAAYSGVSSGGAAVVAAAAAGFLLWNWPPAKIFLGDVGSGFLGYCLGVIALHSVVQGSIPIWAWLILLAVFVADATVTLARRAMRHERWWEAHRQHAYQHLVQRFGNHLPVTAGVLVINLLVLGPAAWLAVSSPKWAFVIAMVVVVPLGTLAVWCGAGIPAPKNPPVRRDDTRAA